ncbi:MAG: peptide-methionine (S)-S-oxide reductase MsrA [Cyanobacteria bacterium]|nr:peptide-methionine (S)-S-oxide reductase MsrA [Cyanobacteriota bacterium]
MKVVRSLFNAVVPAIGAIALTVASALSQEKAVVIPAPAVGPSASQATSEVAVFAGGCFWGVQGVYQRVKGVTSAVSGYAGGEKNTAKYEIVSRGGSGHAESVRVTYDPRQISYGRLLQVFFSVVHDPTTLNRQGPDVGTQYRSAIFPSNAEQETIAAAYIAQLNQARVFRNPIVTKIELDRPFFDAERYHQDYLIHNQSDPYILYNDLPKIAELKRVFPELYLSKPVLAGSR